MVSAEVKWWLNYIDTYTIYNYLNEDGRSTLIWGAYSKGHKLCDELERRGIPVSGYIDGHKNIEMYMGKKVYSPQEALAQGYYVVVAIEGVRKEIKQCLIDFGYEKERDYLYFAELVSNIKISELTGEYRDIYGNRFVYEGDGGISIDVHCIGGGNELVIMENYDGDKELTIILSYGSKVQIGENFKSYGKVVIDASMSGDISLGNSVNIMSDTRICAKYNACISIGDCTSIGERLFLTSGEYSKVTIGNDCMISHDVSICGTNSHSILDLENEIIRSATTEHPVVIGNHVWLGKGCSVLYGTNIGAGSIVGMQSLAKGDYPCNSVIAGNIAKVVRTDCTWDRRRNIDFEEF